MGIKGLHKFLRDMCPEVFEDIHISEYAYKKVAIDISLYLYLFKASYGKFWLKAFIQLVQCLRKNEIHCVFIYDFSAPPEKAQEQKERREVRARHEERVVQLEQAIEKFYNTNEVEPILIEFQKVFNFIHSK